MLESIKIIEQAMENIPAGPVNVDVEGKAVLPDKSEVYRSIEGLIQHFELVMPNRGFRRRPTRCTRRPNPPTANWASTSSPTARTGPYRAADAAAVVHSLRGVPAPDRGAPDQRRGGGAGELEHHRGGVGPMTRRTAVQAVRATRDMTAARVLNSMTVLSDQMRAAICEELAKYPDKQAVTLPALHIVQDALRHVPLEAIREIAEILDLHPAEVHDTMSFYGFFRDEQQPLGKHRRVGLPQPVVHAARRRRAAGRTLPAAGRAAGRDDGRRQDHAGVRRVPRGVRRRPRHAGGRRMLREHDDRTATKILTSWSDVGSTVEFERAPDSITDHGPLNELRPVTTFEPVLLRRVGKPDSASAGDVPGRRRL